jgi:hypothetical protein
VIQHICTRLGRGFLPLLTFACLLAATRCSAQREYIGRYDLSVGFSDINAPFVNNLNQVGVGTQIGMVHNRWLASGFDFSTQSGNTPLTANLLPTTLQLELGAALPPGYSLRVPTDITIQTYSAGTQLTLRHYGSATFFIHPVLSAFHIEATPHPGDPIAAAAIKFLIPSGKKTDTSGGYGIGGGTDLHLTRHMSARMQLDAAWSHPVNDLLGNGGWIYRFSVGPSFHFGHDINKHIK